MNHVIRPSGDYAALYVGKVIYNKFSSLPDYSRPKSLIRFDPWKCCLSQRRESWA